MLITRSRRKGKAYQEVKAEEIKQEGIQAWQRAWRRWWRLRRSGRCNWGQTLKPRRLDIWGRADPRLQNKQKGIRLQRLRILFGGGGGRRQWNHGDNALSFKGRTEYLVQWTGYASEHNTWLVPLLVAFLRHDDEMLAHAITYQGSQRKTYLQMKSWQNSGPHSKKRWGRCRGVVWLVTLNVLST